MKESNIILDDLAKEYLDGTKEGNSKFILEIYESFPQLLLKESGMKNILKDFKISHSKIILNYKNNDLNILDYIIKKQDISFLSSLLEKKKNIPIFIETLKKPLVLFSLLHQIGNLKHTQKQKINILDNTIEIEQKILKDKKHKKTNISDVLKILFEGKTNNILQSSLSDNRLFNLEFILNYIPNKNFSETTTIKGKDISNDILLITSLTMTGILKPLKNIDEMDLKIINTFNSQISKDKVRKILTLNTIGLESIFDKTISIKAEKLVNLANSSLCLIELNKEDTSFMKSKEVEKCLTILGNNKIIPYYKQENPAGAEQFDLVRRELLEQRMNAILIENKIAESIESKNRKKI